MGGGWEGGQDRTGGERARCDGSVALGAVPPPRSGSGTWWLPPDPAAILGLCRPPIRQRQVAVTGVRGDDRYAGRINSAHR